MEVTKNLMQTWLKTFLEETTFTQNFTMFEGEINSIIEFLQERKKTLRAHPYPSDFEKKGTLKDLQEFTTVATCNGENETFLYDSCYLKETPTISKENDYFCAKGELLMSHCYIFSGSPEIQTIEQKVSWHKIMNHLFEQFGQTFLIDDELYVHFKYYLKDIGQLLYKTEKRVIANTLGWMVIEKNIELILESDEYLTHMEQKKNTCFETFHKISDFLSLREFVQKSGTQEKMQVLKAMFEFMKKSMIEQVNEGSLQTPEQKKLTVDFLQDLKCFIGPPEWMQEQYEPLVFVDSDPLGNMLIWKRQQKLQNLAGKYTHLGMSPMEFHSFDEKNYLVINKLPESRSFNYVYISLDLLIPPYYNVDSIADTYFSVGSVIAFQIAGALRQFGYSQPCKNLKSCLYKITLIHEYNIVLLGPQKFQEMLQDKRKVADYVNTVDLVARAYENSLDHKKLNEDEAKRLLLKFVEIRCMSGISQYIIDYVQHSMDYAIATSPLYQKTINCPPDSPMKSNISGGYFPFIPEYSPHLPLLNELL